MKPTTALGLAYLLITLLMSIPAFSHITITGNVTISSANSTLEWNTIDLNMNTIEVKNDSILLDIYYQQVAELKNSGDASLIFSSFLYTC